MDISINYLAVLAAAVAYMIIGSLWYGPLFGKQWRNLMGLTPENMKAMSNGMTVGKAMTLGFISAFVMAQVLAHEQFVWFNYMGATMSMVEFAFQLAFWLWLGFLATTQLGTVIWEGKSWRLWFLNITAQLVSLFAMALILTFWR